MNRLQQIDRELTCLEHHNFWATDRAVQQRYQALCKERARIKDMPEAHMELPTPPQSHPAIADLRHARKAIMYFTRLARVPSKYRSLSQEMIEGRLAANRQKAKDALSELRRSRIRSVG